MATELNEYIIDETVGSNSIDSLSFCSPLFKKIIKEDDVHTSCSMHGLFVVWFKHQQQ